MNEVMEQETSINMIRPDNSIPGNNSQAQPYRAYTSTTRANPRHLPRLDQAILRRGSRLARLAACSNRHT